MDTASLAAAVEACRRQPASWSVRTVTRKCAASWRDLEGLEASQGCPPVCNRDTKAVESVNL